MTLHHQFVRIAKKYGDKTAIIDRSTNRELNYSRALIASLILSEKLKKYDTKFIGIMIPTSAGCILSALATLIAGKTPIMINYSTQAANNCRYAQRKCDFKLIITSKALLEKIECEFVEGMIFIEDLMKEISGFDKVKAALRSKLPTNLLLRTISKAVENETATILFTSGSEKDPKAVQLSHKNFMSNVNSLLKVYDFNENDVFLANLPLFHVFGQMVNLWAPLTVGGTIVTYANPLEFKTICDIVREYKITIIVGTPSFFFGYLSKSNVGDFESCRLMIAGADKCPAALQKGYLEKHNKTILEAYGTTETSPGISVNSQENNKQGSCGKPLDDVLVRIENYETGEECPVGTVGKILVKGDNVMKGYFDDFEQTSLAIRNGWYDTGDMGFLDEDGFLWHSGRLKRFVKIGGEMVSLIKVEDVLEKCLPEGIKYCVVELPDQTKGAKILAAVTQEIDTKEILKKMSEHLPNIALPKQFVVIEELPVMGSGKIDFRKTTEMVRGIVEKG